MTAGCGGHGRSFVERADGICARREAAISALSQARTPAAFARLFERRARLAKLEASELQALEAPDGMEAAAGSLVDAIDGEIAAAERLRVASLIGDSESIQGALYQGRQALRRARGAAARLGLGICGHVANAASP